MKQVSLSEGLVWCFYLHPGIWEVPHRLAFQSSALWYHSAAFHCWDPLGLGSPGERAAGGSSLHCCLWEWSLPTGEWTKWGTWVRRRSSPLPTPSPLHSKNAQGNGLYMVTSPLLCNVCMLRTSKSLGYLYIAEMRISGHNPQFLCYFWTWNWEAIVAPGDFALLKATVHQSQPSHLFMLFLARNLNNIFERDAKFSRSRTSTPYQIQKGRPLRGSHVPIALGSKCPSPLGMRKRLKVWLFKLKRSDCMPLPLLSPILNGNMNGKVFFLQTWNVS